MSVKLQGRHMGNGSDSGKYIAGLRKGGCYHLLAGRLCGVKTMAADQQHPRAGQGAGT